MTTATNSCSLLAIVIAGLRARVAPLDVPAFASHGSSGSVRHPAVNYLQKNLGITIQRDHTGNHIALLARFDLTSRRQAPQYVALRQSPHAAERLSETVNELH